MTENLKVKFNEHGFVTWLEALIASSALSTGLQIGLAVFLPEETELFYASLLPMAISLCAAPFLSFSITNISNIPQDDYDDISDEATTSIDTGPVIII